MKNYIEVIKDTLIFHGFDAIDKEMTIFRSPEVSQILIMPGHIRGNGHMYHYVLSDGKLKDAALALLFKDNLWTDKEFSYIGGSYMIMERF